jgi:hypothetical protein
VTDLHIRYVTDPAAWPPFCDDCGWQHTGHCEDAAGERRLLAAICARAEEVLAPLTTADVPPALRGPNWKADT